MGQVALHALAHVHKLLFIPEALPQVAQIGHDDNAVGLVLPEALLLQRQQRRPLALQRRLAQRHHVGQLRQSGNTDQQPRPRHTGGAAFGHLLQPACAQLLRSGGAQHTRRLRQAVHALYHAAHTDAHSAAAGDHGVRVAPQKCQIKFQLGILPHSDTSCLCSIRIKFNFNRNTIAILYHKSGSLSHLFAKFSLLVCPGQKKKAPQGFLFLMYGCLTWQP